MRERPARYSIQRPLQYTSRTEAGVREGAGETLNISARGLLFRTEEPLEVGAPIELVVRLREAAAGETGPVELRVEGVVVRSEGSEVAVRFVRHKLQAAHA